MLGSSQCNIYTDMLGYIIGNEAMDNTNGIIIGSSHLRKNLAFSVRGRDFIFKNCYFLFVLSIEIL